MIPGKYSTELSGASVLQVGKFHANKLSNTKYSQSFYEPIHWWFLLHGLLSFI